MKTFSLHSVVQKIAFSTGIQGVSKALQLVLSALSIKLISNFLEASDLGIYGKIGEFALFFSVIGNLGIFGNTLKAMADKPHDANTFMNLLVLRILTLLPFFILGIILGTRVANFSPPQIFAIILLFTAFMADGLRSVAEAALQAHYKVERAAIILLLGRILEFGLLKLLIHYGSSISTNFQLTFLVSITCFASLLMALTTLGAVRSLIVWKFKLHLDQLKTILITSLPFGLINICNNIYFRFAPQYFIAQILTDEQFASFSMAFRLANVAALLSTFLMFSVFPGFRQYIDNNEWDKAYKVYKGAAILLLVAGIGLVLFGSFLGPFALEVLTKKQLVLPELWFVLPMMLLLAAISYGYDLILITLFAFNQEKWLLKREAIAVIISIIIFVSSKLLPIPPANIIMILAGAIIAESFVVCMGIYKINKIFQQKLQKA